MSSTSPGLAVTLSSTPPAGAIEIDIGGATPIAFTGLRRLLGALGALAPDAIAAARAAHAPEWNRLDPTAGLAGDDLLAIADAPNQRRLFRESEQTFRVLNVAAHALLEAVRRLGRPLALRNAGACDLVSLRGLMHAVELARLLDVSGELVLGEWHGVHAHTATSFRATRAAQLATIARRMRARDATAEGAAPASAGATGPDGSLEGRYLACVLDRARSAEDRIAAALLAVRACFFSTNYEGATLAIEAGRALLAAPPSPAALQRAWDRLDDPQLDIPMLELDRTDLRDAHHLRAQLHLHEGVICSFTGRGDAALAAFAHGLAGEGLSPACRADLHLYRGAALTKRMGQIEAARREIGCGLAALAGCDDASASLSAAWLHNLAALTHFQERDLDGARQQEELALARIDGVSGDSATHLKTNLISNFSVLAEVGGDLPRAIRIWRTFEPLNAKLGSANAFKVHAFRLATLHHLDGDADAALASFERAFREAEATGDAFNGESIAAAIARLHLARADAEGAAHWYAQALARARRAGDCLHAARDHAGLVLATGGRDFSAARASLAADSTHALANLPLAAAVRDDDPAAVLAALPLPKSKLTRPFDQVNVQP